VIRIKICGITRTADAIAAVGYGACALGFNFYQDSPRYIEPEEAGNIIRQLPPFISAVGIFVNAMKDRIDSVIEKSNIDTVQLHGDETPEFCAQFSGVKIIKAFRIKKESDLARMEEYSVNGYLIDAYHPELYGGSGFCFPWEILESIKSSKPLIVAGGLTPSNVGRLLETFEPYGVDVCSGIELKPGIKDHDAMKKFIKIVGKKK
jgi:phosphoribosylanthranilate isomerase